MRATAGFSLIEMIGVMAIMAILATVMVPNILRSIERAAVKAEVETVRNLGEHAKLFLRDNNALPNSAFTNAPTSLTSWNTQIATYASLSPAEILVNRRAENRLYVVEAVTPPAIPQRALLISSMRSGAPLPTAAFVRANFVPIWDWVYNSFTNPRPPGFNVAAWPAEITDTFLVIERINFAQVYRTDLATYTIVLQNQSIAPTSRTVSYRILNPDGSFKSWNPTVPPKPAAGWQQTITLGARERLNLYSQPNYATLDYTYVGASGQKTFDYTDTQGWKAP